MPLGTSLVPDTVASHLNNVIGNLSPAQVSTAYGAGNVRTASKNFSFNFKGQTIHFLKGVPVVVDASLAAALLAANAPVT